MSSKHYLASPIPNRLIGGGPRIEAAYADLLVLRLSKRFKKTGQLVGLSRADLLSGRAESITGGHLNCNRLQSKHPKLSG